MPEPHRLPDDLIARAARVRLLGLDVDGTLTDGRLYFDSDGRELKAFHVLDGQGLVLLRKVGVHVAFVTARASVVAEQRARELGLEAHTGVHDKLACIDAVAARLGIDRQAVAFMGDDLPDLRVMPHVGLSIAPANAHPWVRERADWVTGARGGHGAAREVCDVLLQAQGHAQRLLDELMGARSLPQDTQLSGVQA